MSDEKKEPDFEAAAEPTVVIGPDGVPRIVKTTIERILPETEDEARA